LRVIAAKATVINEKKAQTLDQMLDQIDAFSGMSRPPAIPIGWQGRIYSRRIGMPIRPS
jgi:hypothetical protein